MLPKDLTKDIKDRLKTISGQINGVINMLDKEKDPELILLQFKSLDSSLKKAQNLLLDEVFRKSLAIKIADALKLCPGNCGQEEKIELLRQQFPNLDKDELTRKIKEISSIAEKMENEDKKSS